MSSGLQRRRVAATESPGQSPVPESSKSDAPRSDVYYNEEGKKVAYDPEDINNSTEEVKPPRLTLMEEVILLGLKDTEGYLSFWNDNISYALRGCIIMELAFRGKIAMVPDASRRRLPLADRYIQILDSKLTGEALLDETIKIIKSSEPLSVGTWIDYLSGETWNLTKISYQLKQVRERLCKGLVDKGILRTEKRNFFLFDMATHPIADTNSKEDIKRRVIQLLSSRTVALPDSPYFPEGVPFRHLRSIALVAGAYAATVLENVLVNLSYDARDHAFNRADELLNDYSEWPFIAQASNSSVGANLAEEVSKELSTPVGKSSTSDIELQIEVVAAVLSVYAKLDSIL